MDRLDILARIAAYDCSDGSYSDVAQGSAYDLMEEAKAEIERLRADLATHVNATEETENRIINAEFAATETKAILREIYEWYDQDGSVGGASEIFEKHRAVLEQNE